MSFFFASFDVHILCSLCCPCYPCEHENTHSTTILNYVRFELFSKPGSVHCCWGFDFEAMENVWNILLFVCHNLRRGFHLIFQQNLLVGEPHVPYLIRFLDIFSSHVRPQNCVYEWEKWIKCDDPRKINKLPEFIFVGDDCFDQTEAVNLFQFQSHSHFFTFCSLIP